ncbi:RNA polymerase sigma-70 factor [Alistipes sp. OttesenSCG-928-B03]|nr:RNA polymerase sigma-70 factor [Alistipes sp. OttesenSCG-928-B03]
MGFDEYDKPDLSISTNPSAVAKGARGKPQCLTVDVLTAMRDGDHEAFDVVFRSFYPRMKAFLNSLLRSAEDAEELTQDVFVNLWLRKEQVDPAKNFNAYIYTMARNAAFNFLRKKNLHDVVSGEMYDEELVGSSEDEVFAREAMLLVKLTVAHMPEQRRRVYEMSRVENMTNDEIAAALDINKKVVERHLRYALNDIRETLHRFSYIFFL